MLNVLLVEDSQIDRVLVEGLFKHQADVRILAVKNGAEALEKLSEFAPDVVLTDLQMPEMDGLQLVTALRLLCPQVPVVLMTAHGNESIALQALEQGATSYVPKSQLKDKLIDTIRHVVAIAHSDRSYERLTQSMDLADLRFHLAHDKSLFKRLVDLLGQLVVSMEVCEVGGQVRLGMAVEEALDYMLYRGNYELNDEQLQRAYLHDEAGAQLLTQRMQTAPYRDRRLTVECRVTPEAVTVIITHQGPALQIPPLPNMNTPLELEAASNRSLVILTAFLDEVLFTPDGRGVTLIKRREAT